VIAWTGAVEVTADGLRQAKPEELKARDQAVDRLRPELAEGPRKAAELFAAAAVAEIPERALEQAKQQPRVESHKERDRKWNRAE
jgi:hypothetical protein